MQPNRRDLLLSMAAGAAAKPQNANRPNILYILADDLGYGDLRCYNKASKIPTPHLDRFAGQGMRFTDAHSPSAVCTPTRYGIMTGRYCWRTKLKSGVLWGYSPALIEQGRMTVASMLKKQGYHTGCVGKWHLGLGDEEKTDYTKPLKPSPLDYGFDYFFGIPASLDMDPYLWIENDRAIAPPTGHVDEMLKDRGIFWRAGAVAPGFKHFAVLPTVAGKASAFLMDHARQRAADPFFLYVPLTGPHTPWLPGPQFQRQSQAGPYGDFVAMVDDSISRILKTLDELELADNTLVIVTSDNGAHWLPREIDLWKHRANHFLHGQKADIWDGGHRIPFMARWPGKIEAGAVCDETVCLTDLIATAAEIVGVKLPGDAGEDSFSILPALLGRKLSQPIREATVHHSVEGHFAIRAGEWKLIIGRGSGGFSEPKEYTPKPGEPAGELYNMAKDPSEEDNLYLKRPDIVKKLSALLERYKTQGYSRPRAV